MPRHVLVINPNSNENVTAAIDKALDPLRTSDAPSIRCITVKDGPYGIESQQDFDVAAELVPETIRSSDQNVDAFVIACYSDPGLRAARALTHKPVFGIAETGLATAIMMGGHIGVISILPDSVDRHWAYAKELRLQDRVVGDLPVNLKVAQLVDEDSVASKMLDCGKRLRDEFKANVILLGCAGMARYRQDLEDALEVPVIDPTQAATAAAISSIRLGYNSRLRGGRP